MLQVLLLVLAVLVLGTGIKTLRSGITLSGDRRLEGPQAKTVGWIIIGAAGVIALFALILPFFMRIR